MNATENMQFVTPLERYCFEKYVLEVCIATLERGGTTSKLDTYEFVSAIDAWGISKYPGKTAILLPEANLPQEITAFIHTNKVYLQQPDCWFGTWIDPCTGNCYLDITAIYPCLEEARREAIALSRKTQRRIIALYNFKYGQTHYLESGLEDVSVPTAPPVAPAGSAHALPQGASRSSFPSVRAESFPPTR